MTAKHAGQSGPVPAAGEGPAQARQRSQPHPTFWFLGVAIAEPSGYTPEYRMRWLYEKELFL